MSTGNVEVQNLPGIIAGMVESGLGVEPYVRGPKTLVLGVAAQGQSAWPYTVTTSSIAASEFGSEGTLTRGMYEARQGGAENVVLYRMGSTSAKLMHVGDATGAAGYTIETATRDDTAGASYTIYYDDTSDRIVVWSAETGLVVYDNDATDPVDLLEVYVSGHRAAAGGPDIAGPSAGFALEDVVGLGHAGASYTAGTDGSNPSRMELFQYLYKAYDELAAQDFDYVIPMDVYLDDQNIVDGDAFGATYLASIISGGTYPTPGSSDDILGKVFVEEYHGQYYFFWDLDGDGVAELYPNGIGSCVSGAVKISGDVISAADFHEVNFGYQLARFCHKMSVDNNFVLGVVGCQPPASNSLEDISAWVGKKPTYTTSSVGVQTIAHFVDNGTGLLGNKFMAGQYGFRGSLAYGGIILTDTEFLDGIELTDTNGFAIDIGRYISTVCSFVRLFNSFDLSGRGYVVTAAPTYLAYVSSLDEQQAPTNKVMRGVQKVVNLSQRYCDSLAGCGYVSLFEKPKGLTWSDAPTSARPTSDFRRLVTMRIVKRAVKAVRDAGDPFIGNSWNPAKKQAMENAIGQKLDKLVQGGYIVRHQIALRQTAVQKVLGKLDVDLMIVPSWELRRITLTVTLQPQ
jgi:hypothetical protein